MRYDIGTWHIDVPNDIEIYQPDSRTTELIAHSAHGANFKRQATDEEKQALLTAETHHAK